MAMCPPVYKAMLYSARPHANNHAASLDNNEATLWPEDGIETAPEPRQAVWPAACRAARDSKREAIYNETSACYKA